VERQQRTSVDAFLAYAEQAGLAGRIALAWASSPESTDKLPTVDEVIRTLWDEDIADWEDEEGPAGRQHARIRQALAEAVPDAASFRRLVLACFSPFLLQGVATTGGEMIGALVVPLAPDAELTNDLMWLVQELQNELRRQMRLYTQIQQEIASEIVGRVSHIFRNRLGNAIADLSALNNFSSSQPWYGDYIVDESLAAEMADRVGRPVADYTVGGYLHRLQAHLNQLRHTVGRMQQYFRGGTRNIVEVDINAEIERQLQAWSEQRPDVRVVREFDPLGPVVRIPREDIGEIMDNILSNCSTHMRSESRPEDGHHLTVMTQVERDQVIIKVRNSGDSSLPPNPTEIWVTTDAGHGTGLGLATVVRNARKAGGTFAIRANEDGPGVTNELTFPNARWKLVMEEY
jgi:signal transduction histidine kinase